ncbi:hypothetical protein CNL04643 [Cryptococcus deneoformans JEC21]|uniref:Uncharacterized protein n=1 Tax=Cryptococcus deneoformans (strain JEC21 / ATCC MYA-565) TaxID=214684 RepID=A0A0S2M693_CRYD1|nr:hypothetical protein CNL04643 [Cryptococcus neoformans var. neoformans JEC21]ALO69684.1 hypothetical protein CNL04643 [Cryptococcus neoformans var. neoformans JEC21]
MTSLTRLLTLTFWLVLLGLDIIRATDADTCMSACTDWAVVMLYCRWEYADRFTTNQDDYIYNNQFVACLCQGQTASTAALGNSTISASASTCSTCATTPSLIVQNINDFLDICTVQAQNGTASGALTYRPQVYNTNTTDPQPAEYYS